MTELTRAQALRELGSGFAKVQLVARYGKAVQSTDEKYGGWRKVVSVSPSGIVTIMNNAGATRKLDLPAASLMEYFEINGDTTRMLDIYDKGLRPLSTEERIILEKTASMEYWSRQMVLQKYGMDKLFNHRNTETYDYVTKMIRTPKVKGNLILKYYVEIDKL